MACHNRRSFRGVEIKGGWSQQPEEQPSTLRKLKPWNRWSWGQQAGVLASCRSTSIWHGERDQTCAAFSQQVVLVGKMRTYFIRTKGIGTQRRARQPNTVDAHRGFRAVYILVANNYGGMG